MNTHSSSSVEVVDCWEHKLRKYLLLLASLAATVTYAAGLDPPGGSWVKSDSEGKAVAGDSILRATNHRRYLAFYYSNATAFAASLVVILLLLVSTNWRRSLETIRLGVLRIVMVLDLIALMVAYTAGSCRDKVTRWSTGALVFALSAYVGYHFLEALHHSFINRAARRSRAVVDPPPSPPPPPPPPSSAAVTELEQLRKMLMLLSIFAATIAYDAGLKPPGGFWEHTTNSGLHRPGEVILSYKHGGRFAVFFVCNTIAFIASLFTVVLLLDKKLTANKTRRQLLTVYGFVVLTTLVTLVLAYAAGSCRKAACTSYTLALAAPVLVFILLAAAAHYMREWVCMPAWIARTISTDQPQAGDGQPDDSLKEKRSLVLLLATLAASITYQAGLNPPGGVWLENQSGHNAGDPILLSTDDKRYTIFFYCNLTAFVASIVVILMVQIKALIKRKALQAAIMFDLVGLMGAYITGSSRTLRASVHVIVLAAFFLVYVTGPYLHAKLTNSEESQPPSLKKRRKRLLLCAILMAAITYQAGLNPPGGFWREEQGGHSSSVVGSPILEEMYPGRYQAFFYCNAMSFMASIALIMLLQGDETYQPASIRFHALYACMLVGMLTLMGAYAAGTARRVRTSIYVFVLVGGVVGFIAVLFGLFLRGQLQQHQAAAAAPTTTTVSRGEEGDHAKRKYVMLLAMLAASVTYQAGLEPPGGVWPDGYAAGSSVLHDSNLGRYHVFFYSNSTSFVASIVVIILLLQSELRNISDEPRDNPLLLIATNTVVVLDLLGLLVAYATGSSRNMKTSLYVIILVVAVVIYIMVHVALSSVVVCGGERSNSTEDANGPNNGHQAQAGASPSQVDLHV